MFALVSPQVTAGELFKFLSLATPRHCTIAVWHGPGMWRCELKATARKPYLRTGVQR